MTNLARGIRILLICVGLVATGFGLLNGERESLDHGVTMKRVLTDPTLRPDLGSPSWTSSIEFFGGLALILTSTFLIKKRATQ